MKPRPLVVTVVLALLTCATVDAQGVERSENKSPGGWTAHVGFGSSTAWNFAGLSKDLWRNEHVSLYAAAGLGTILVGVGAAYYMQRSGNGVVLSATAGLAGAHASAVYQLRMGGRSYLVAGGSYGQYFLQYRGVMPVLGYERRF